MTTDPDDGVGSPFPARCQKCREALDGTHCDLYCKDPDAVLFEKRWCDEVDRSKKLEARIAELEQALSLIDHEAETWGHHADGCPGNHPAYCDCATGTIRRFSRHALEKRPRK